jgi:hypothetical protein
MGKVQLEVNQVPQGVFPDLNEVINVEHEVGENSGFCSKLCYWLLYPGGSGL